MQKTSDYETVEGSIASLGMQMRKYLTELRTETSKYGMEAGYEYQAFRDAPVETRRAIERELELISNQEIKMVSVVLLNNPFAEVRDYMKLMNIHKIKDEVRDQVMKRREHRNYMQHYYDEYDKKRIEQTFKLATNLTDVEEFLSYMNARFLMRQGAGESVRGGAT